MISEKIVVVDDDQRIHSSLKLILCEHQIISFLDPYKALEYLLGPNEVKLAIVDVCMQGLNGIELLDKLKRSKDNMAVMIITAHGNQDIIVDALRKHADDFIEKPFDILELKDRVRLLIKEKSRFDLHSRQHKSQALRMREYIQRNPNNASLNHIAREMCMSSQYLGRIFSRQGEGSFRDYKLKVRMEKGMDLLNKTSLDITEIAFKLGYENPESFMRVFKRFTRLTPSEYRDKHQSRGRKHEA